MRSKKRILAVLSVLLCMAVVAAGYLSFRPGSDPGGFESTDYAMGTYVQQTVYGKNGEAAAKAASSSVKELENLISWRIEDSDVARLNAAAGTDWIAIDPRTAAVLAVSLDVGQKSGGAFDPTILPVSSLWDFGGDNQHVPADAEIKKFDAYVDYRNLRVDTQASKASLKLHYMAIDLGGIGKGAACDEALAAYRKAGADYGIIAVGGSIGVYGSKPDGSPWRVAVRDPHTADEQADAMGQIELASGFLSTSGSYEKYFIENGVTYHHLLDPKTGYPAKNGLISVTVKADNGALSDALSTACFVLGLEKGKALLAQYGADGVFIDTAGKVYVTAGLKESFQITNSRYVPAGSDG